MIELASISGLLGWFGEVWDQIRSVDIQYLIVGCALQSIQTVLNGLAWRNILAESYGADHVPARPLVAAYAGGIGLNSFLPAQAGTFGYFGMFRVIIAGSAFAGILAAGVVQNLFFGLVGGLNYVFLFFFARRLGRGDGRPGIGRPQAEDRAPGPRRVAARVRARLLWKRYRHVWEDAKEGAVILRHPRRYVSRVRLRDPGHPA